MALKNRSVALQIVYLFLVLCALLAVVRLLARHGF
jgi:hypothetical protein